MKRVTHILNKIIEYSLIISLALLSIIVSLQVFSRYLFSIPMPWSTDINRILFIYLVFLGATIGIRDQSHLNIDILVNKFPKRLQKLLNILVNFIILVFLITLVVAGLIFVLSSTNQVTSYLRISISYYYLAIPLSAIAMVYYISFHLKDQIKNFKK